MIIVGKLIFSSQESDEEKNSNKKKKIKKQMLRFHVERFCLSCHGDALWADTSGGNRLFWLVLLLHVCMCPCAAHTNTHTQCTVRCLWRMVAYWTSASASEKNIAIPHEQTVWSTSTGLCWRRGEALIQHTGDALGKKKTNTVKHLTYPDCWLDGLTEKGGRFL